MPFTGCSVLQAVSIAPFRLPFAVLTSIVPPLTCSACRCPTTPLSIVPRPPCLPLLPPLQPVPRCLHSCRDSLHSISAMGVHPPPVRILLLAPPPIMLQCPVFDSTTLVTTVVSPLCRRPDCPLPSLNPSYPPRRVSCAHPFAVGLQLNAPAPSNGVESISVFQIVTK